MDWSSLYLFMVITARMTGFVVFNPILGRTGIPSIVKSGFVLLLSVTVFFMEPTTPTVPITLLETAVHFLLEMVLGYVLGLVVNIFFYIPLLAGSVMDLEMGMSMGATYDPSSGTSITVSANLLNILTTMLFIAANGIHSLLRIIMTSGDIVPFGMVVLNPQLYQSVLELFIECTLLGVKLCMPILAAELMGQVGMGILMKVMPQINVFAINIELKVIIGLMLMLVLMVPFSEYLLEAERTMLVSLQTLLSQMNP